MTDVLYPGQHDPPQVTVATRSSEGDTPLHVAAWRDDVVGAKLILDAGADVNALGDMDQSPLHVAITRRNVELISLLLGAGADPLVRSQFGHNCIEEAQVAGIELGQLLPTARGT
ncbi:MAG: ankyrin repeat domain-containing protein [Usitatibacteraceae bacterium]